MPVQRFPIRTILPDGTAVFEERFWSASNTPIFGDDGELICIYHATIEITKQIRAEQALRRSEQQAMEAARQAEEERHRLDAVLEAAPVGITVADAQGGLQQINTENRRIWGYSLPAAQSVEEYREWKGWWYDGSERHGQRVEAHEWPLTRALYGGDAAPANVIEIETFDAPSRRRIVYASAAAIKSSDGSTDGAVVAIMDITDRVRAEESLKEEHRRKDEFLAMLAHELRNPLAPIAAAAELLGTGQLGEERVRHTSAVIARQVGHMTGLVDDLLDVSRVTRGLVMLQKEKLDAKRIAGDAVEQVRPLIEARAHRLTVHTPPQPAFVLGDQKRLVQVLANLLTNAAKYTPSGGDIILGMDVDGSHVRITVSDNGIGMAPELLKRAFELFAQAQRSADRSQGGLGIGLALVRSLVELHGGRVTAHSDGIGKGSRFTVCLPHVAEQDEPAADEPADAHAQSASRLKVMVVDDNVDAAQMISMLLEVMGHSVIVEHSARKALKRGGMEMLQVFFLDIGLPDMDGYELARQLRSQPENAGAILVAVTGYGQERDRSNALDSGFNYHFVKPISTSQITALLSEIQPR